MPNGHRDDVQVPSAGLVAADVHENDTGLLTRILKRHLGETVWDDGAEETARRVIKYWDEMGERKDFDDKPGTAELPFSFTTFDADASEMVVVPCIEFSSLCAHHLMPFSGMAHVAYVSNKIQVGLSKIPRLVDFWARRPQIQEQLTHQIAKDIKARLDPYGVMVVMQAHHTCMSCRGVRKHNGAMVTSLPVGVFFSNPHARDEFFSLVELAMKARP